jgi:hypothetical protein
MTKSPMPAPRPSEGYPNPTGSGVAKCSSARSSFTDGLPKPVNPEWVNASVTVNAP